MSPLQYRKTRFVCVSDTHNTSPETGAFKLPKGDVLIHAGDLTKQGTYAELRKTLDWIENADFEEKIVIAGNHDITLDSDWYAEYGLYFHNQHPQDAAACKQMFANRSIRYLNHESALITLKRDSGPRTAFKVFGSPYSPARGLWAFGYQPEAASALWDQIPLDVDITVTHTPPKYHCDESRDRGAGGCGSLRQALWQIRPQLAVCGHIHEGRGAERIFWDLDSLNVKYKEGTTGYWTEPDPGSKKQCLLDLTTKGPAPLRNTRTVDPSTLENATNGHDASQTSRAGPSGLWKQKQHFACPSCADNAESKAQLRGTTDISSSSEMVELAPATRGQGGAPPSGRCDLEALSGRLGRQETCVINAAIMASSWPHGGINGRKYNKPFVVDIELPTWESLV
ncbi:MAG: hypothetical protein Q9195_007243 [Heterodermia aff. obscurata]